MSQIEVAMTETEWLACSDPEPMLDFLRDKASDRKRRLFAVACFRIASHLFSDERIQNAVEVLEQRADGKAPAEEIKRAYRGARDVHYEIEATAIDDESRARSFAALLVYRLLVASSAARAAHDARLVFHDAFQTPIHTKSYRTKLRRCAGPLARSVSEGTACNPPRSRFGLGSSVLSGSSKDEAFCRLMREVFGTPSDPISLDPSWLSWRDGTVPQLAQAIYDDRAFDRLPILADALEDAGCDNADILDHCRRPGEHVRGCWVVDLLLGKE